jgi:hypothetical protein
VTRRKVSGSAAAMVQNAEFSKAQQLESPTGSFTDNQMGNSRRSKNRDLADGYGCHTL